jgi:rubrerythrin
MRFAEISREEKTKQVLFTLAEEEKVHVKTISRLFDEKR